VVTDDPLAPLDIPHMCRQEGYEVVSLTRQDDCAEMLLRRPEQVAP
jgi:TusA-related sulfurtransferase